ncbi:uncharacterized protein LOC143025561 isoform X2 [Oratosquilla oratoria]
MAGKLTTPERVELVLLYAKDGASSRSVADIFNVKYPNRQPVTQRTVSKILNRFKETGSVHDRSRSGRRTTATDPETSAQICRHVERSPHKSLKKVSQETGRILSSNHFHPYKVQLVHELHGDDMDCRKEYCEWFVEQRQMEKHVLFSDEAIFHLNSSVNRHNSRFWSKENPYWIEDVHVQYCPRIMVWVIWGSTIIGP